MAGSSQNRSKSSLWRDGLRGKATDFGFLSSRSGPKSNSELSSVADPGSEGWWVSYQSERETTHSKVKAPNS